MQTKLASSPLDRKTNGARLDNFYASLGFIPTGIVINPLGDKEMFRHCKPELANTHTIKTEHAEDEDTSQPGL